MSDASLPPVRRSAGKMRLAEARTQSGTGPTDAALVVAARADERWAQEALFRRHSRMVNGLAFRLMGRDADVDDLVQDSFIEAFAGLGRLKNPQAFASWLCAIVVRTAHKRIRRRRLLAKLGLGGREAVDVELVVSRDLPPDVAAELSRIYRVLDRLPAELRIALVLRRVEGMSIDEIAETMHLSPATVKRRLTAAAEQLEKLLAAKEGAR
jgi:RNA polymerase sigma-70 factor, ECF subfamily